MNRSFIVAALVALVGCGSSEGFDERTEDEEAAAHQADALTSFQTCGWGATATLASCSCAYAGAGATGGTFQEAGGGYSEVERRWGSRTVEIQTRARCPDGRWVYGEWDKSWSWFLCEDGHAVPTSCRLRVAR